MRLLKVKGKISEMKNKLDKINNNKKKHCTAIEDYCYWKYSGDKNNKVEKKDWGRKKSTEHQWPVE